MAKFAAPPIRTPFIGNPPKVKITGGEEHTNVPSYAWTNYFQRVTDALSAQPVPVSGNAVTLANIPIQFAVDANFLYVAIGKNQWKKVALSAI